MGLRIAAFGRRCSAIQGKSDQLLLTVASSRTGLSPRTDNLPGAGLRFPRLWAFDFKPT